MYKNSIDMIRLLNVKLGAVQSTYMAKWKIEIRSAAYRAHFRCISCAFPQYILPTSQFNRRRVPQVVLRNFRYISCAFPQLILRVVVRSLSCALPQHKVRIPQLIVRIFRSISCATPQVPCACARSSAQLAHGQMRIPPS